MDFEEQDMDDFVVGIAKRFCPECGTAIVPNRTGKPKKFCSDVCRWKWWRKHPKPENWKSTRTAICLVCGKQFLASREYDRPRKYCSRACANKGRWMGGEKNGQE